MDSLASEKQYFDQLLVGWDGQCGIGLCSVNEKFQ